MREILSFNLFQVEEILVVKKKKFNESMVTKSLLTGWIDKIAVPVSYDGNRTFVGALDFELAKESLCPADSDIIIYQHLEKRYRKSYRGYNNCFYSAHYATPVDKKIFLEVLPKLTSISLDSAYYSFDEDYVKQSKTIHYTTKRGSKIVLDVKSITPSDEVAAQCFLNWVVRNSYRYSQSMEEKHPLLGAVVRKNSKVYDSGSKLFHSKPFLNASGRKLLLSEPISLQWWSKERLLKYYSSRLPGAKCLADIADFGDLALPNIEQVEKEIEQAIKKELEEKEALFKEKNKKSACLLM